MEVSSHALKQYRTATIAFDGMVFTNLSPEHLDFHPDMEDYFQAKLLLFTDGVVTSIAAAKRPVIVANADDEYGKRLISLLRSQPGCGREFILSPFMLTSELQVGLSGVRGSFSGINLSSSLAGRFNASNILAAVTLAQGLGLSPEVIAQGVLALKSVPGRLERVLNSKGIHVLVDYAHKPDALEKVLKTLCEVRGTNRLITVFGCGGDRDRKKRPVMGRLAVEFSDYVYITSDNPRTEDAEAIIQEILVGTVGYSNFLVEKDRKKAIFEAIHQASAGDIVLIAGKGHENYQIVPDPVWQGQTIKVHFDDCEVAALAMQDVP
jgi:UDP-N-acetylmuramoyl-L-alanyl-D-glutamate--2,6-diaminopimelate ligase